MYVKCWQPNKSVRVHVIDICPCWYSPKGQEPYEQVGGRTDGVRKVYGRCTGGVVEQGVQLGTAGWITCLVAACADVLGDLVMEVVTKGRIASDRALRYG